MTERNSMKFNSIKEKQRRGSGCEQSEPPAEEV